MINHPDKLQILIAFDQLINALLWGYADETLSARAYRHAEIKKDRRWPMMLINGLFFWQDNHCKQSYESELKRAHLPPFMRD